MRKREQRQQAETKEREGQGQQAETKKREGQGQQAETKEREGQGQQARTERQKGQERQAATSRRGRGLGGFRSQAPAWGMLGISLAGFGLFYLIPFLLSGVYSFVDHPLRMSFVGLKNYRELLGNVYFLRGLGNTALFMAVGIPLNMGLSLGAALVLRQMRRGAALAGLVFLIPLALPSATSAYFWQNFFGLHGTLNRFLACLGIQGEDYLAGGLGIPVMAVIFIWKNMGYDMALFLGGLGSIPEEYYECARAEGAGRFWQFCHVTLVYLTPTLFLALIMTFVNSFKVFKEIYLITGEYPPQGLYVLQHYMNNMFLSLNYPKLVSAVYLLTLAVALFVSGVFWGEHKLSQHLR